MKKIMLTALAVFVFVITNAQDFKGNLSGTVGLLNSKARIQYELPIGSKFSTGLNLNYYFTSFSGPLIEPFFRLYGKSKGNTEGWFLQAKLGYGNLKTEIEDINNDKKRFSTYGGGIAVGNKFFVSNKITIEPLIGFRVYSPPPTIEGVFEDDQYGFGQLGNSLVDATNVASWISTTGFPLDFQLKVGYQF
jgi:hypothetical protein